MYTLNLFYMFMFFYMSGVWVFCSKRKHLLIILLSLEYMVLFTFVILLLWLGFSQYNMYLSMIYLVFSVCEGGLGLGILVSVVRFYGNDYFQSLMLTRC